jgi:ribosome maturation factor RimP
MVTTLIESVRELTEPIILSQGLELVDIEFFSEPRGWVLRFYVDKEGGVTLEHCSRLSEQLGDVIDVKEIIPHRYILEVSSPGVNRILKKEKDFIQFRGEIIKVRVSEPVDGRKHFLGTLVGCRDGNIIIDGDAQQYSIPIALISKANIAYQFPELTKKGKKTRHNSPGNRGV